MDTVKIQIEVEIPIGKICNECNFLKASNGGFLHCVLFKRRTEKHYEKNESTFDINFYKCEECLKITKLN